MRVCLVGDDDAWSYVGASSFFLLPSRVHALASIFITTVQADFSSHVPTGILQRIFQSLKVVSGLVVFVRGSLKFVRGQNDHGQIVLPGVSTNQAAKSPERAGCVGQRTC